MIALVVSAWAIAAPEVVVVAATHEGKLGGGVITWRSTFVADPPAWGAPQVEEIALAVPLPWGAASLEIERSAWTAIAVGGRSYRRAEVVTSEPAPELGAEVRLHAPLARGTSVQAVYLDGADGARFEPGGALAIERHIGFSEADDVSPEARALHERLLGGATRLGSDPIFVTGGNDLLRAGGLTGAIRTSRDRRAPAAAAIAVAFVAVLLGLSAVYKRLARGAERERAEAILEAEIRRLPQDPVR